jgi:fumarylacetoacetate (FAA) hydrolase family protein
MRKLIAGVTMHLEQNVEWYTINLKNQDGTYTTLLSERFDRKKSYGVDFAISVAERILSEQSMSDLTDEEINWIRTVDAADYQIEILAAGSYI